MGLKAGDGDAGVFHEQSGQFKQELPILGEGEGFIFVEKQVVILLGFQLPALIAFDAQLRDVPEGNPHLFAGVLQLAFGVNRRFS